MVHFDDVPDPRTFHGLRIGLTSGSARVLGRLSIDLVDRSARMVLSETLRPRTLYRLSLDPELRGMGGGKLGEEHVTYFTTGLEREEKRPSPPPPVLDPDVMALLSARCAGCHGAGAELDLGSAAAARASLIGRPSRVRPELPRVRPGDHASSVLVWRLLGVPLAGPPVPHGGLSVDEIRLIATWIDGGAR